VKFSLLDGIILAVIAFGLWRGFVSGLIRELSQIFGIFAGFAIALQVMKPAGVFLVQVVNVVDMPLEAAALLCFLLVFILVYIIVFFLSRLLERVADEGKLAGLNKTLGGVVGAAKAALVLSITLVFLGQIGIPNEKVQSTSYLHAPVERIAPQAWEVVARSVPTATTLTSEVNERFWKRPKGGQNAPPPKSPLGTKSGLEEQ
jgi:membrane protein required for colicin V production